MQTKAALYRFSPSMVFFPVPNFVFAPLSLDEGEYKYIADAFEAGHQWFLKCNPSYNIKSPDWLKEDAEEARSNYTLVSPSMSTMTTPSTVTSIRLRVSPPQPISGPHTPEDDPWTSPETSPRHNRPDVIEISSASERASSLPPERRPENWRLDRPDPNALR